MQAFPPQATMPGADALVFDVTDADFESTVIARSMEVPVLLDCWAPWCGPCKSLTPILEKVVRDLAGTVLLAKLNSDENPGLAQALRLRSIPHVLLIKEGRVVDQFTGALPEGQVRKFLERHVSGLSEAELMRQEAAEAPDTETAEALLHEALQLEPGNAAVLLDLAERVIARGALDEAEALLTSMPAEPANDRRQALLKRIELARNKPAGDAKALSARIAANARDFDARFALAAIQVYEADFNAAFDQLLEVVLRDKGEWREKARLQLIEWFNACGDAEAVSRGRRYLGMYLN
jgi:putative thioredoxin